jgi:ferredoxin-nitrate reductase
MHWGSLWAEAAEANAMTHSASCPDSKQPELKACAVQLVLVGAETAAEGVAEVAAEVGEFNWAKSTLAVTS